MGYEVIVIAEMGEVVMNPTAISGAPSTWMFELFKWPNFVNLATFSPIAVREWSVSTNSG